MNLLLTGGTLVGSLEPPSVLPADLLLDDGRVAAIDPRRELQANRRAGTERLDCTGCLVVPGNVCAHTHLYSGLARGMPYALEPPHDLVTILQRIWWRLDRALDEDTIRASALAAGMEALRAGTTTLIDHHASPEAIDGSLDIVAEALATLGLRAVLAYEVTDRDGPERAQAGLAENRRFLGRVGGGVDPLLRGLVGAHASFTLSPETLDACVDLAQASGSGLHVHLAEDAADQRDALARFGTRVVARLQAAGALTPRALLAHGVHLDPDEAAAVRASGATVAHNPRSNLNNGVGRPPLGSLGERVALGTDGIGGDLFEETRTAFFRRREESLATTPEWALARLAEGARLAGGIFGEPLLGTIAPGAPADLAVLDYAAPTPLRAENLAGHWVYGLTSGLVRDVLVAGELVVRDRDLVRVDEAALTAQVRGEALRLWDRLDEMPAHPFRPAAWEDV